MDVSRGLSSLLRWPTVARIIAWANAQATKQKCKDVTDRFHPTKSKRNVVTMKI